MPNNAYISFCSYGNGHVIVGNISKDEILQEYKSHLDEVHSVVWCPEPGDFLSTWRAELKGKVVCSSLTSIDRPSCSYDIKQDYIKDTSVTKLPASVRKCKN